MARVFVGVLVVLIAFVGVTSAASAGIPDPNNSRVDLTKADPDGMATCPDLDSPVYQYVRVTARRADNTPIAGIPYGSFFFTVTGGNINLTNVDALTDVNGEIRFQADDAQNLVLGSVTIECQIYTVVLNDSDVLGVNSFDINGDGGVGVQDATLFVADYGTTNARSDFSWDGVVAVQDATLFVAHYGH
jgi:hypothetical protein